MSRLRRSSLPSFVATGRPRLLLIVILALMLLVSSGMVEAADAAVMGAAAGVPAADGDTADGTGSAGGDAADTKNEETRPDRVSAMTTARVSGKRVEDLSQRTETTKVYANPDGSWTESTAAEPEQVKDADGVWHPVDLSLVATSDGLEPKYGPTDLTLSDGGDRQFISLTEDGRDLGYRWPTALPKPVISGATATYEDVAPDQDLVVTATVSGFEYSVVLKERPDPADGPVSVTTPVATDGARLVETPTGGVDVKASGETVLAMPAPQVYDSSKDETTGDPAVSPLDMSVTAPSSATALPGLTLTPDPAFLADPTTEYPVTIDPVGTVTSSGDTWIASADATTSQTSSTELRVGTNDSGAHRFRSFIRFDQISHTSYARRNVIKADLSLYNFGALSCTGSAIQVARVAQTWSLSGLTWANQPTQMADAVTNSKAYGTTGCPSNYTNFDITNAVKYWKSGGANNGLRIMASASETSNVSYRRYPSTDHPTNTTAYKPHINLTYNDLPTDPTPPQVVPASTYNGTLYAASTTPTLSAKVSDPDGGTLTAAFEVATTAGGTPVATCNASGLASGATATCQVPDGQALTNTATYYARVRVGDGTNASAWSSASKFTVTTGTPAAPTILCDGYTSTTWTTTVPATGTRVPCIVSAPTASGDTPSAAIVYTVGTGTEKTVNITPSSDPLKAKVNISLPATEGRRTIVARAASTAGVKSSSVDYWFGFGSHVGLENPSTGPPVVATNRVAVAAGGHSDPSSSATPEAHVYWRLAGSGDGAKTGWTKADASGEILTVTKSSTTGTISVTGSWNAATAQQTADGTTLDSRVSSLLDVEVCIAYADGLDCSWESTNGNRQILRVPHAFGDSFPAADVEGGQVALWTGELSVGVTDVNYAAGATSLSISRTAATFDGPPASAATGVFGKGWTASLDGPDGGLADMQLIDRTRVDGTLVALDGQGTPMVFAPTAGATQRKTATLTAGAWSALDDDTLEAGITAQVSAVGSATQVTLIEPDGTKTLFTSTTTPTATTDAVFAPGSVTEAGDAKSTRYGYDAQGRVTRIVAPAPTGLADNSCPVTGTMAAGCRALAINYATSTTATGSSSGDYSGMVSSIYSQLGTSTPTKEASYAYDASGRLVAEKNERNNLITRYGWDGDSTRLGSMTPPGLAPVNYEYAGDQHRLARVKRDRPTSAGGGTATLATILYNVPTTGSGLPSMDADHVKAWGQTSTPTYATAVFRADNPVSTLDPANVSSGDWASADLSYTDARGYEVNTASYGAGAWLPTWTSYDPDGNVIRQLDAGDIAGIRTGQTDPASAGTITIYNADHTAADGTVTLSAGTVETDTYGPASYAVLDDGTRKLVRPHSHTTYDQGAPNGGINSATGQEWALPTTVTVTAADADTLTDIDTLSTTTTSYDDAVTTDTAGGQDPTPDTLGTTADERKTLGWTMALAGSVTQVMPGSSNNVTNRTHYDTRGRVVEQLQPKSTGTDAGTRQTAYYTADGSGTCGAKPTWDGLTCTISYAAAAAGTNGQLPTTTTVYDDDQRPTIVTETANGATRTTTTIYRPDGQPTSNAVTTSGDGSTAVPKLTYSYDPDTALPTNTTSSGAGAADPITMGYDSWGRQTTYSAAQGETTTTAYDPAGRVTKVVDPKGTTTYGYNGTDAAGDTEHRGLATSMSVSNPGGRDVNISGAYDAEGSLTVQKLPGGITQRTSYNTANVPIARSYSGDVTTTDNSGNNSTQPDQIWVGWSQDNDVLGRVRRDWTPSGAALDGDTAGGGDAGYARQYAYDRADRLTKVIDKTALAGGGTVQGQDDDGTQATTASDPTPTNCTVREYAFDRNGNRTAKTTTQGNADGTCGTGSSTKSWNYDGADKITGGYAYDQFGRVTTLPQADTPLGGRAAATGGTAPGDLTIAYYATDAVRSISQGGFTGTFTQDSAGRRLIATTSNDPTTVVRHYTDESDNPGWTESTTQGQDASTVDRYVNGLDGNLGINVENNSLRLSVTNLHSDVATYVEVPSSGNANGLASWQDNDEFGNDLSIDSTGNNQTQTYGWLGGSQRESQQSDLVLMGARVYNPVTGSFTSRDPIYGGNVTSYTFPADAVNSPDVSGLSRPGLSGSSRCKCNSHNRYWSQTGVTFYEYGSWHTAPNWYVDFLRTPQVIRIRKMQVMIRTKVHERRRCHNGYWQYDYQTRAFGEDKRMKIRALIRLIATPNKTSIWVYSYWLRLPF